MKDEQLLRWLKDHEAYRVKTGDSEVADKFLVQYDTNGDIQFDGAHSKNYGVAQAKSLYEKLAFLRKPGCVYKMVTIEEVPNLETAVNQDAIDTLNEIMVHND
jgi:hypothetical protein